jgi:hypothetical protein
MSKLELANKFLNEQGVFLRTEYPDGFKGFRGYYAPENKFIGASIDAAFSKTLDQFLDNWDEDNASDDEINYINSVCDLRTIKSFSAADEYPSFVD